MRHLLCIFFICLSFLSFGQPQADFISNKQSGCSPLTVQFTSTSTGNPVTYLWDFGNGNTSTLQNPGANFITPGTYTISLTVSNASGNHTRVKTAFITVFANPTANFYAGKQTGCAPVSINLFDSSLQGSGIINSWSWDFFNGSTSTVKNPTATFINPGTYMVSLVVRDVNGCQSTRQKSAFITVLPALKANFGASQLFNCSVPFTVNFTDSSSPVNPGYIYEWDFGDGTKSGQKNPTKTYTQTGSYAVKLKISLPNGCVDSILKTSYINIGSLQADFSFSQDQVCAPSLINTLNQSNASPPSSSAKWYLDGVPMGSGWTTQFSLNNPGTFTLKLVTTQGNCRDSIQKTITVAPKFSINFSASDSFFCNLPATVNFTSSTPGANYWQWNFGDGKTSNFQNPAKVYNQAGVYSVTLTSTNSLGCRSTLFKKDYIKISLPEVKILASPKKGCKPLTVSVDLLDTIAPFYNNRFWSFGDGWTYNGLSTTHTYTNEGDYILKVRATNANGCIYEDSVTIEVGRKPDLLVTIPKTKYCFNEIPINWDDRYRNDPPKPKEYDPWFIRTSDGVAFKEVTDTGWYKVRVKASYKGCDSTHTSDTIVRVDGPIANFIYANISLPACRKDSFEFTNRSKLAMRYKWEFGDGDTSVLTSAVHKYKKGGTYKVMLTAYDTVSGCFDTASAQIYVPPKPSPKFRLGDTIGCIPFSTQALNLTTFDTNVVTAYYLYTIDGKQYGTPNPIVTSNKKGVLSGSLEVNVNGCTYSYHLDTAAILYTGSANFSINPFSGCAPLKVNVRDVSVTDWKILSRKWHWGNGDSLIVDSANASYTYTKLPPVPATSFTLTLTVTDSIGCRFSATKPVVPQKPNSIISFTRFDRCGYDSIIFSAGKSNGNAPLYFNWNFGNGISSFGQDAIQQYFTDSVYHVQLVVTDQYNCRDTARLFIDVKTKPPIAGMLAFPRHINCPGPPISFYDNSSAGAAPISSRIWTFGDASKSVLINPQKIYLIPGIYNVSLTVTDTIGCKSLLYEPGFIIVGGPRGTYSFSPDRGCTPLEVTFTAQSPNAARFEWDLGDGVLDTNANLKHTYPRPGVYIPNITVTDSTGCKVGVPPIDTIKVFGLPDPDFAANEVKICKQGSVTFKDMFAPQAPIVSWKWDFGVLGVSLSRGPHTIIFNDTGIYTVSLQVVDTSGCTSTITKDSLIEVFDDTISPTKPIIYRATVEDNNSVLMEFKPNTEPDFKRYRVWYDYDGLGNPQLGIDKNNIADTTFTELGLNTLQQTYSYQVHAEDVCRNISPRSIKNTTIELKAKGVLNANLLNWSAYAGWDSVARYEIYKNDPIHSSGFNYLASVPGSDLNYIDSAIYCTRTFYYRIKAVKHDSILVFSWSDTAGASPDYVSSVPATQNIRATVVNNKNVLLQWVKKQYKLPFSYLVYKAQDDETPVFFKELSISDTAFVDADVKVQEHSYTYVTYLKDACGSLSPASNKAKTILLKADVVSDDVTSYDPVLTWSKYLQWNSGIERYELHFYFDSLSQFSRITTKSENEELKFQHHMINLEQEDYCYVVKAFQKDSTWIESESNIACVNTTPRLYAPNVFTLNADGLNDYFVLKGVFIHQYQIRIFDRWGMLVFESNDFKKHWDGKIEGKNAPADVYVFTATGIGRKGQVVTLTGNVTLLR